MHENLTPAARIAWAAGLFEGEGSWFTTSPRGMSVQVHATLTMTDRDVVEAFAAVVGCGRVDSFPPRDDKCKPSYRWVAQSVRDVRYVIDLFLPFLGERRMARANEVLDAAAAIRPNGQGVCHKGHPLSGDNLRMVKNGVRMKRCCIACDNERARDYARARRAAAKAAA